MLEAVSGGRMWDGIVGFDAGIIWIGSPRVSAHVQVARGSCRKG